METESAAMSRMYLMEEPEEGEPYDPSMDGPPACVGQYDNVNPHCKSCPTGYHCYHQTYSGYEE